MKTEHRCPKCNCLLLTTEQRAEGKTLLSVPPQGLRGSPEPDPTRPGKVRQRVECAVCGDKSLTLAID